MWLLFTYLSIYAAKAFYTLCSLLGKLWNYILRPRKANQYFQWLGVVLGIVIMVTIWVGAGYTRHQIIVTREQFYFSKLPTSFDGYKVVQLSDLHVGTWGKDTTFIKNIVDSVNSLHPDIIVFTGDLVNRQSGELLPFVRVLSHLKAKDGIYSILGNHDYGDYVDWEDTETKRKNLEQLKDLQKEIGWKMLNNESEYILNGKDSILLIGVENWGDPPFPQYGNLHKALASQEKGDLLQNDSTYKLLLSHNPEHWNQEISQLSNIDLTLAGHTHAMQGMIKIGGWKWSPAKYRYKQWGGKFTRKNSDGEETTLYVNTGAGEVGIPARFLSAYPEITLITLRKK